MNLIDVNVAKSYFLKDGGKHPTETTWQYGAIVRELDSVPKVDAIPVRYCKECANRSEDGYCIVCKQNTLDTDFCSYWDSKMRCSNE